MAFKISDGVFRGGVAVRYAFIERYRTVWPIARQCQVLKVSTSGYRQYRARQTGETGPLQAGRRNVKSIFNEMKGAYGQAKSDAFERPWRAFDQIATSRQAATSPKALKLIPCEAVDTRLRQLDR